MVRERKIRRSRVRKHSPGATLCACAGKTDWRGVRSEGSETEFVYRCLFYAHSSIPTKVSRNDASEGAKKSPSQQRMRAASYREREYTALATTAGGVGSGAARWQCGNGKHLPRKPAVWSTWAHFSSNGRWLSESVEKFFSVSASGRWNPLRCQELSCPWFDAGFSKHCWVTLALQSPGEVATISPEENSH